jgi:hypothetical protein
LFGLFVKLLINVMVHHDLYPDLETVAHLVR